MSHVCFICKLVPPLSKNRFFITSQLIFHLGTQMRCLPLYFEGQGFKLGYFQSNQMHSNEVMPKICYFFQIYSNRTSQNMDLEVTISWQLLYLAINYWKIYLETNFKAKCWGLTYCCLFIAADICVKALQNWIGIGHGVNNIIFKEVLVLTISSGKSLSNISLKVLALTVS